MRIFKVTLPYHVGITTVADFTKSCGNYTFPARRRISIVLVGSLSTNELRLALAKGLRSLGGTMHESLYGSHNTAYKCAPGFEYDGEHCGVGDIANVKSTYKRILNADFCLEVPGNTPTRSQFYYSVLSGCIPVIFDFNDAHKPEGSIRPLMPTPPRLTLSFITHHPPLLGRNAFAFQKTHWAWRYHVPAGLGLQYDDFTVSYDVRKIDMDDTTAILNELYQMPRMQPERFQALRQGVARAARHMYYSMTDCGARNCDAFESFKDMVIARGLELGEYYNPKFQKIKVNADL